MPPLKPAFADIPSGFHSFERILHATMDGDIDKATLATF
jgi:hypothetical protein